MHNHNPLQAPLRYRLNDYINIEATKENDAYDPVPEPKLGLSFT